MAQPIVVAGATAESGAAVGPVRNHGARSYSRMADGVKTVPGFTKPLGIARSLTGSAQNSRLALRMSEVDASPSIADEVEARDQRRAPPKNAPRPSERVTALFLASAEQLQRRADRAVRRRLRAADQHHRAARARRCRRAHCAGRAERAACARAAGAGLGHWPTGAARGNRRRRPGADGIAEAEQRRSDRDRAAPSGEKHLLAIAGRWWLQEIVTDALLARRFPSVSRRLVDNPGARVSPAGFAMIVAQAVGRSASSRLRPASGPICRRSCGRSCCAARPKRCGRGCCRARRPICSRRSARPSAAASGGDGARIVARARFCDGAGSSIAQLKKDGAARRSRCCSSFARQKRYEETVAALAELAQTGIEIVRPLMQSLRSDGILVPCKVAGLRWETVGAILDCRFSTGVTAESELAKLKGQYARADRARTRIRLLKLWSVPRQSRRAPNPR